MLYFFGMPKSYLSLLTCILFLLATPAAADDPPELISDRPDQTESPNTVPPGFFQLELGASITVNDIGSFRRETLSLPETLLRIGLSERLELRLGWAGVQDEEVELSGRSFDLDGNGDTELGFKIGLSENAESGLTTALLVSTSVPTGDDEFTSDRFDPSIRFALGRPVSERIDLGLNVGVAIGSELNGILSSAFYSLATGFGLTDRLGAYIEIFGDVGLSREGGAANYFDGGFTFLVRPDIQLDIEGGVGLSDNADDWYAGIGLVVFWPGTRYLMKPKKVSTGT